MGDRCPYGSQQMNWKFFLEVLYIKFTTGVVIRIMKIEDKGHLDK